MYSLIQELFARAQNQAQQGDSSLHSVKPLCSHEEALAFIDLPQEASLDMLNLAGFVRSLHQKNVFTCGIINAKSGRCPENCAFCAQSAHHNAHAPLYPLVDADTLVRRAEALAKAGALRFGIVTSGTSPLDNDMDTLCTAAERIVREVGIKVCGSLGILTEDKAKSLKQAGFSRYHHNLETTASHFDAICSTHRYHDDTDTARIAKTAGLELCCGGILGLGENRAQRVELAETVAELDPHCIPLNFLTAIKGTPLENMPPLSPMEALRSIALFRLMHPSRDIVICGGRGHVLQSWQSWIFSAGASAVMTGNYLTTTGCEFDADNVMLAELGLARRRA